MKKFSLFLSAILFSVMSFAQTVPTNEELWEAFKPYYNTYYGLERADQPITNVSTFASAKMQEIMTDEASDYKWLGDYVLSVATAAGVELSTDMAAANEGGWRWAVHAFFNAAEGQHGAAGIDFTEAGKPEAWGPAYLAAQGSGAPEIEWIEMPLEITNLTTSEIPVGDQTVLQLMGRNDMMDSDVMLFLNNYTGEDKAYEVNAESSLVTYGGMELTVMDGSITKSVDPELGEVFAGIVHASVGEDGETMYVAFDLKMYALPAIVIELDGVEITVNEESASAFFNATWEGSPLSVEVSGFEEVEFKEYPECWLSIGDDNVWVDAAAGPAAVIIEGGVAMLEGEFTSFATGKSYEVMLTGTLPVKEEPVVEQVYEENKLNPFAFGLESALSEDASVLTVTYRLNNSNATSVDVVVYNGEEVVATISGTTTIGKNTVEVATVDLPAGVELTWGVVVKGTSVDAPTQEEKMYSMYCPHGLAIDKDPESEYFGRILVADAMSIVKDKTGYLGSGIGAGLHVFNPSFTTDSTVYTGGNDFTRILASNGYQPWRVKISEDGRIFVSSLDLNGVAVWEVSKDLQTWTPVIAGTNDATDYNIYDADSNFVAGLNCSMDVIGSGEDLKLLLYSTNNKGIAFNQSGYRLDEYALGTATTWTGTPKNIINGGAYGVVHTNVEFIYDGEGGYWFGGSRAGNAGQPNLVHINAAGEQDYYTEDAGLYGGDGVLVHNGMLFKGKARTSSTVGNFGVWTIGKDEAGKVTLTEKWSVVANGIGRNLNEFAVDYAENLYVVGNSGEKIIAYALPYSGEVTTPAASQYGFKLASKPTVVAEMVGVVKRALQDGENTIVLTHEEDGAAHIYSVVDGTITELVQDGVIAVDPENAGDLLAISDIALTEDGKLVAVNYMVCQAEGYVDEGYKRGENRFYIWNSLNEAPSVWFKSIMYANWFRSNNGQTMAIKGTSANAEIALTGYHATKHWARIATYKVIDGVYTEPADAATGNDNYTWCEGPESGVVIDDNVIGANYELNASPLAAANWIIDGNLVDPIEYVAPAEIKAVISTLTPLAVDLGKKFNGASIVAYGEKVLMVAPYATAEGLLAGVKVLDITAGLAAATEFAVVDLAAAVEATAAATAVQVVEGGLVINLVADATLNTLTWYEPVATVGVVKRAVTVGDYTVVLTHEENGAAHLYKVIDGVAVAELSQEGVIAVDPENAGDFLAISDIAATEDGKLVAANKIVCQSGDDTVDEGYKRGEFRAYIWDDLAGAPSVLLTSKMSSNWYRSIQGNTIAYKGTSTNGTLFTTGVTATGVKFRYSVYNVIDGVYTEPAVNDSEHFHFTKGSAQTTDVLGANYQLVASPLAATNWILDGELVEPFEIVDPLTYNTEVTANPALAIDLGKKYNGASIVTVGEQVLMVAPYATAEGLLAGVKVLDITAGLDAATEVATADLDAAVEATAAATAVAVAENVLTITLVADATIYTLNVELESEPDYMLLEDEITNLVIDLESMAIIGGPSTMWQVEVFLGLAEDDNMDGQWSLSPESSVAIMGFDARLIDGYVYDIDVNAPAAKAVLHVEDSGFFYEIKLNMTSTPTEAIVVVVEDATVTIDTIPLFGDQVDYALKMTADWTYAEDGVTYPVLVEVPVYYPEATEPSEMTCTVTIGGWGDNDPWLGFGEGTLTITTVDGVVTAKGIIANPYTGVAFDVTVSGKLPQDPGPGTGIEDVELEVKAVKVIKNGQLIISKDGKEYNAQGAIVK